MNGVAFLPEELRGAQERTGGLFPAHDGAPLIVLHGQITPGLHPLGEHGAEDGFRGRAHSQALLQLFGTALGHPGHFRRKPFHMLGFLEQKAFGDQHREIHILMPGFLKALVHLFADALPDGIAVGAENHAATDRCVVAKTGLGDHVGVPLREVFVSRCDVCDKFLFLVCHGIFPPFLSGRQ